MSLSAWDLKLKNPSWEDLAEHPLVSPSKQWSSKLGFVENGKDMREEAGVSEVVVLEFIPTDSVRFEHGLPLCLRSIGHLTTKNSKKCRRLPTLRTLLRLLRTLPAWSQRMPLVCLPSSNYSWIIQTSLARKAHAGSSSLNRVSA